jgi:hypothetical protein
VHSSANRRDVVGVVRVGQGAHGDVDGAAVAESERICPVGPVDVKVWLPTLRLPELATRAV